MKMFLVILIICFTQVTTKISANIMNYHNDAREFPDHITLFLIKGPLQTDNEPAIYCFINQSDIYKKTVEDFAKDLSTISHRLVNSSFNEQNIYKSAENSLIDMGEKLYSYGFSLTFFIKNSNYTQAIEIIDSTKEMVENNQKKFFESLKKLEMYNAKVSQKFEYDFKAACKKAERQIIPIEKKITSCEGNF